MAADEVRAGEAFFDRLQAAAEHVGLEFALVVVVPDLDVVVVRFHVVEVRAGDGELEDAVVVEQGELLFAGGFLKLSVSSANLYYVDSDDNYIKVWYDDNKGELQTYMLRCRLKTVEESFAGSDLIRCHRKFIVNMGKVKVLQKVGATYEITLDNEAIAPIPVTKTYIENVLKVFKEKE